jgi:dihydroflavonol-4-reductase
VNNEGTRNVLHEALRAGAERVLHTSTESILVCAQSSDQSVEELRLTDENMIGPYCLSKLKGEQEAFRLANSGAPVIVACPTVFFRYLKDARRELRLQTALAQSAQATII